MLFDYFYWLVSLPGIWGAVFLLFGVAVIPLSFGRAGVGFGATLFISTPLILAGVFNVLVQLGRAVW